MTDFSAENARLTALETRNAYQEDTIAQLSEQIYTHQKQLDRLERVVQALEQKLKAVASGEATPLPENERPPHY